MNYQIKRSKINSDIHFNIKNEIKNQNIAGNNNNINIIINNNVNNQKKN